jgi:hypothetical protein
MKYILAMIACAGVFITYVLLASVVFEWKHGGGAIPKLVLILAMSATWRAVINKYSPRDDV